MRSKPWLVGVVILLPLFFLAGGVGVTVWRRADASSRKFDPAPPVGSDKVKKWLSEGTPGTPITAEPVAKAGMDRPEIRRRIAASLDRLYDVTRRSRGCKELWPEAATEEEGRALQREHVALRTESGQIHRSLGQLAEMDPGNIVEMVRHSRELAYRLQLMGLIAPDVDDEILSEDAPCGPLLAGLLTLAQGDTEEKLHLASFAGRLTHGNRELGRVLLGFMEDPDRLVRINGATALSELTRGGSLREFLKENTASLKRAAVRDDVDNHSRGCAIRMLATLETDEADDFILEQFERMSSFREFDRLTAMDMAGARIAARHEGRYILALQKAFELPYQEYIHHGVRQLIAYLPEDRRATLNTIAEARTPPASPGMWPRTLAVSGTRRRPHRSLGGVSFRAQAGATGAPGISR